ncbi:MAG: hypothetical protein ACFFCI_15170 [Promethearchaeota archaeon]
MIPHLPCKKCGSCLPVVKGSIVQCPYCGARNYYMESFYTYKYYMSDILHLSSMRKENIINKKELERRKFLISSYFYEINSRFKEYRHLIITKLDTIDFDPLKLFFLIRASGNFEIIVEQFLLKYLEDGVVKKKYQDFRDQSYIINKSLLGLYFTYLAKLTTNFEKCSKFYRYAQNNFQNIVDYCNIITLENNGSKLDQKRGIYSILARFTAILRNILDKNPNFFSGNLEELLKEFSKIKVSDVNSYNLYTQIENVYKLERNTFLLLEKVRVDDPLSLAEPVDDDLIFECEEKLDKLNRVRNWIEDVSVKYQKYQRNLLKLHSGRLIKYLDSYRSEFINIKNKNAEKFDDLIGIMINKALESYNQETIEALDIVNNLMQKKIYNGNLIETFKIGHDDLIKMEELVKNFATNLFQKPLLRNLGSEYYKKLISLISGKHTEFDKFITKSINRILKNFEDYRNKEILSIEEQRDKFISEIKPNIQKLIDLSFTLNEEILPYPLFIDIEIPHQKLKVNNPETITLNIENPNSIEIKNIKIYFFMPEAFQNKMSFTSIKKLKANETRKIKARIIPKEKGNFLSVVMIEYQHFNKDFWMPSIKFKLVVEEVKKVINFPVIYKEIFQNNIQATRTLKVLRSLV